MKIITLLLLGLLSTAALALEPGERLAPWTLQDQFDVPYTLNEETRILLVAPPPFARLSDYAAMFEGGPAKSRALAGEFRRAAAEHAVDLLDAGEVIVSSDLDGIHFEAAEHLKLGAAVAARVRAMLA